MVHPRFFYWTFSLNGFRYSIASDEIQEFWLEGKWRTLHFLDNFLGSVDNSPTGCHPYHPIFVRVNIHNRQPISFKK